MMYLSQLLQHKIINAKIFIEAYVHMNANRATAKGSSEGGAGVAKDLPLFAGPLNTN